MRDIQDIWHRLQHTNSHGQFDELFLDVLREDYDYEHCMSLIRDLADHANRRHDLRLLDAMKEAKSNQKTTLKFKTQFRAFRALKAKSTEAKQSLKDHWGHYMDAAFYTKDSIFLELDDVTEDVQICKELNEYVHQLGNKFVVPHEQHSSKSFALYEKIETLMAEQYERIGYLITLSENIIKSTHHAKTHVVPFIKKHCA